MSARYLAGKLSSHLFVCVCVRVRARVCVCVHACSEFSKSPQLLQFTGRHCKLRRSDGALLATSLSPFPILLHQHASAGHWEPAVRLCRFVKVSRGGGP